jgi:hypothetical protein
MEQRYNKLAIINLCLALLYCLILLLDSFGYYLFLGENLAALPSTIRHILGLYCFFAPFAIVVIGILSFKAIKRSGEKGRGLVIISITMGIVPFILFVLILLTAVGPGHEFRPLNTTG